MLEQKNNNEQNAEETSVSQPIAKPLVVRNSNSENNVLETENYIIETSSVLSDFVTIKRKDGNHLFKTSTSNGIDIHMGQMLQCLSEWLEKQDIIYEYPPKTDELFIDSGATLKIGKKL